MTIPSAARPEHWLRQIIEEAAEKVAEWPQWKRDAYRLEMEWATIRERKKCPEQ